MRIATVIASLVMSAGCAAFASDVLVVDVGGSFPTIQSAVAAARAGDIILVPAGSYAEDVTIADRGLSIVGEGDCRVLGLIDIDAVPAGETTLLAGLTVRPPQPSFQDLLAAPDGAVDVRNCDGRVRIVDCELRGAFAQVGVGGIDAAAGGPGLIAEGSRDVAVIDSTLTGGAGLTTVTIIGGHGGDGVRARNVDHLTVMRSVVRGGPGGVSDDGGDGGHGLQMLGLGELHIDYAAFFGGSGGDGDPFFAVSGGDGGDGVLVTVPKVWDFQGVFVGGSGGYGQFVGSGDDGSDLQSMFQVRTLDGHPSRLELPLVVREGETYTRRVSAKTGEFVRHEQAAQSGFGFTRRLRQPRLIATPSVSLVELAGPIVNSEQFGAWVESRTARALPSGVDGVVQWQQAVAVDASGAERRTTARPLVILRAGL